MPLTTSDVQQILRDGILQAKLADENLAESISKTLATSVTPALNAVVGSQTGLIPVVQQVAAVMSITEALTVRDAIRRVIDLEVDDEMKSLDAAESLLIADYVDVPKILAAARNDELDGPPSTGQVSTATGSHAASVDPGSVPSTH
jgi:hypothetical protein